jgi:flagellar hook-length control protein FliK
MLPVAGSQSFGAPSNVSKPDPFPIPSAANSTTTAPADATSQEVPPGSTFEKIIISLVSSSSTKSPPPAKKPSAEDDHSTTLPLTLAEGSSSVTDLRASKDAASGRSHNSTKSNDSPRGANKARPADADLTSKNPKGVNLVSSPPSEPVQTQRQTATRAYSEADNSKGSALKPSGLSVGQQPDEETSDVHLAGSAKAEPTPAPASESGQKASQPAEGSASEALPALEEENAVGSYPVTAVTATNRDDSGSSMAKMVNQTVASIRPENGKDTANKGNEDAGAKYESARNSPPLPGALLERVVQTPATVPSTGEVSSSVSMQVARQILSRAEALTKEGSTELTMRLEPGNLGTVRIHLTVSDDTISGRIVVQGAMTQHLVEQQMTSLRQSLADAGIHLGGLSVNQESGTWQEQSQQSRPGLPDESSSPRVESARHLMRKEPSRSIWAGQIDVVA